MKLLACPAPAGACSIGAADSEPMGVRDSGPFDRLDAGGDRIGAASQRRAKR